MNPFNISLIPVDVIIKSIVDLAVVQIEFKIRIQNKLASIVFGNVVSLNVQKKKKNHFWRVLCCL